MKAVKVQYQVQGEYIEQNKANIKKVMEHLRANPIEGMQYGTYSDASDPTIFIHINIARDEATMAKLNDVQAFTDFRMALKASKPVQPPQQTKLDLVDTHFTL